MKTLLIVGAGPGISQSTALRFAKEGFRILLASRNENSVSKLIQQLQQDGVESAFYPVDAANIEQVNSLFDKLVAQYGSLDVVHYNAAVLRNASIEQQSAESFLNDLNVNIAGALVTVKKVFEQMKQHGAGKIFLTGGGFALQPHPDYLSLSIGKAGIRAMAQALFEPFKAENVHLASVTVATFIAPGSDEATAVAEQFWELYQQPKESWQSEIIYPQ